MLWLTAAAVLRHGHQDLPGQSRGGDSTMTAWVGRFTITTSGGD
jgi:hypothetical protein